MARIAVVDDDPRALDVIARCLSAEGHEVTAADSGAKFLELLDGPGDPPQLILLDFNMPEMDGLHVLKELKSRTDTSAIPVVMLSGVDDEDVGEKAITNYAAGFITKPIGATELANEVAAVLSHTQVKDS